METIVNKSTGDQIRILQSSINDPEGLFELETTLSPKTYWPKTPHFHPKALETFTVLQGVLNMHHNGGEFTLKPDDGTVIVKPNDIHCFWNDSNNKVTFRSKITPVGNIEKGIRATYLLGSAGKMNKNNLPKNIFELAFLGQLVDSYVTNVPVFVQKAFLAIIASIGDLLGYRKEFRRITGF